MSEQHPPRQSKHSACASHSTRSRQVSSADGNGRCKGAVAHATRLGRPMEAWTGAQAVVVGTQSGRQQRLPSRETAAEAERKGLPQLERVRIHHRLGYIRAHSMVARRSCWPGQPVLMRRGGRRSGRRTAHLRWPSPRYKAQTSGGTWPLAWAQAPPISRVGATDDPSLWHQAATTTISSMRLWRWPIALLDGGAVRY
jgi:hypothetical protein